jgi:hypothetical protein
METPAKEMQMEPRRDARNRRRCHYLLLSLLGVALVILTANLAQAQSSTLGVFPELTSSESHFDLTLPGGNLKLCFHDFALCAASTCQPIPNGTVTNRSGQTFPSASCLCPILHGPALADVNAGNMNGKNCARPAGGGVWSLFWPRLRIPQQTLTGKWKTLPAIPPNCPGTSNDGELVNCFSWSCKRFAKIDGVDVAQCICPIQPVPTGSDTFAIQSGLCNQSACDEFPVAAPITVPNLCSDQTLH